MSTLYNTPFKFNEDLIYGFVTRDLYALRGSDSVYNCQALNPDKTFINISEMSISAHIQEYDTGSTIIEMETNSIVPEEGIFQIKIPTGTNLYRPRYVYSVFLSDGYTTQKIQYGQLLVES